MLLRRIIAHLRKQEWTAIAIDFVIVVVGVFVGLQVSNWNEARQSRERVEAVLSQLEEEFTDIKTALERQIGLRTLYLENIEALITTLEGSGPAASDEQIREALTNATATGRMPAHSAAYLQLTTSGDLATLGNEELERALIRYHSRLNRDANYHPTLIELVIEDVATNPFVDRIVSEATISGAAIDNDNSAYRPVERIRSYDLEGLRAYEHRYEAMFLLHGTLRDTDRRQLELANEILSLIEAEQRQ